MGAADVRKIEEDIYNIALTRRIRPSEFFVDYDRLRSGCVTESQFFRVLWENLGVKLTQDEEKALASKYARQDGRTDWRKFCDAINLPFQPNDLACDPICQKVEPLELLGTKRSIRPLDLPDEARLEHLLRDFRKFLAERGISLRRVFRDFDTHNIGVVNESQFYRSLPKLPETTDEDIALLVHKYRDPDRAGLLNYLNLANDIDVIGEIMDNEKKLTVHNIRDINDYLPHQLTKDSAMQDLFDRVRVAVFKNGVRTTEFFKDFDKLRSGLITEPQFLSALVLAIRKEAHLSPNECQRFVEFYRAPDGRVHYREFCEMLENAFNIPYLEKKPTETVVRPPTGSLGRLVPVLTECEENQVSEVLDVLKKEVEQRQISMYSYFKDFDPSTAYTRVVTPNQFGRVLHMVGLNVSPEDLRLLCRKFADQVSGDVNYPAFVQSVDKVFVNYTMDRLKDYDCDAKCPTPKCIIKDDEEVNVEHLMQRLRHHVLVNRLRVSEYFADFDSLRSGSITKAQFERGLSKLGLSSVGHHNLSPAQLQTLLHLYENPNDHMRVVWTDFVKDLESVFTLPELDKDPNVLVLPSNVHEIPKPGTMDWRFASGDQRHYTDTIIRRLSDYIKEHRSLVRPCFKDFDKHNNGHVSRPKFRQALQLAKLHCTEAEMQALESRYSNDVGVNYFAFLEILEPEESRPIKFIQRIQEYRAVNGRPRLPEREPAESLEELFLKVKSKVYRERVRIHEWTQDYDKARTGRMRKTHFRRALDLCKLGLQESELSILEDHYQSAGEPDFVDYLRFNSDIEEVFTTHHLDKMPTLEPQTFRPPHEIMLNTLMTDKQEILEACLSRIAHSIKDTRVQMFPMFENFDRVHIGSVTRNQFRRALDTMDLARFVPTETEWFCLWDKFKARVGGQHDVNYVDFCDEIYHRAGFTYRRP